MVFRFIVIIGGNVMLILLLSCLISMEVDDQATTLSFENQGLPSCNQKIISGMKSSVRIGFSLGDGYGGWGSGNYFKLGKYKFVITAAHVVAEGNIFLMDNDEEIPARVIYINRGRDVAIIEPLSDPSFEPVKLKINDDSDVVGNLVNYTGFPDNLGQTTYTGFVSKSNLESILIQSFALPGSSGSVVFDKKGRAVGVVSAVKVLDTPLSPFPELVETLVYVERFSFVNKEFLKEVFMSADEGR